MKFLDAFLGGFGLQRKTASKPSRQISRRSFDAAMTSRLFEDWVTTNTSLDSDIQKGLRQIRARSRDLHRNDDYIKAFQGLCKANIIGHKGIGLQMDITDPNGMPDDEANSIIENAWDDFSKKENFSVTGQLTRQDFENLIVGLWEQDGEYIVRRVYSKDYKYGVAFQIIEPDYLDVQYYDALSNGNIIRMSVELDALRKPVAYWFLTSNPSDNFSYQNSVFSGGKWRIRVPASEIIHRFVFLAAEQTRGIPWCHTAATRLKMLNGYEEAALVASREGACKAGFYEQTMDSNGELPMDGSDDQGNIVDNVEPGEKILLPVGVKYVDSNPAYPNINYAEYVRAVLRGVAAGLGVSYTSLTNDLAEVNYSSIRAGLLQERDMWKTLQETFISHFENDVFEDWLKMALLKGLLTGKNGKPLPAEKFDKFNAPKFIGRRWQWVDPLKDVTANIDAINANLSTETNVVAEQGGDIEEIYRTKQREAKLKEKYGIPNMTAEQIAATTANAKQQLSTDQN